MAGSCVSNSDAASSIACGVAFSFSTLDLFPETEHHIFTLLEFWLEVQHYAPDGCEVCH